jgi:hypothetical protein
MAEFEKGWRVLVHVPGRVVQQGIVISDPVKRKADGYKRWAFWVNVEGTSLQLWETDIEHKTDEPYCVDFVKELQQASLVRKRVKVKDAYVERERIVTPTNEKGYLKALKGSGWKDAGRPVNKMQEAVLGEKYNRLTVQAASAGS